VEIRSNSRSSRARRARFRNTPGRRRVHEAGSIDLDRAAALLRHAARPGIFCGWAPWTPATCSSSWPSDSAPVATTLQGLSSFRGNHRCTPGSRSAPRRCPLAERVQGCDCLLRWARACEIRPGASLRAASEPDPRRHQPKSVRANYRRRWRSRRRAYGAGRALERLGLSPAPRRAASALPARSPRTSGVSGGVAGPRSGRPGHPARFFDALRARLPDDAIIVADDGNHTFLTAELMAMRAPRTFFSPSTSTRWLLRAGVIGAKLARRNGR